MNPINFIHIPRTSGVYIRDNTLKHLKTKEISFFACNDKNIKEDTFINKDFIFGHYGTTPEKYNKNLFNISIIRNPIDRYVSNFLYINDGVRKENFLNKIEPWLYDENVLKYQTNLQSKMLTCPIDFKSYNATDKTKFRAKIGWCLQTQELKIKNVKDKINSLDLLGFVEDHDNFINKYNNILNNKFNFSILFNKQKINQNKFSVILPKEIKQRIIDINYIDIEMYEYAKSTN